MGGLESWEQAHCAWHCRLKNHPMAKNDEWAGGIWSPRVMGEPVTSDAQEYWTSWWKIRCPRILGGLGASDPQESWVSPPCPIPKNIGPAGGTSDARASWVGWGHPILKNDRSALCIWSPRILDELVKHQMPKKDGWAWGIRSSRMMGKPAISGTQDYWASWWDIRSPRIMG